MANDTPIQLAAAAALAGALASSVFVTQDVSSSVGRNGLAYTDAAEEGAPTEVAVGIALGAFRGVFVNFLWLRAQAAKDRGDYFEAMDLSKAITKLQPRFPRVWAFHAWNMAYNISVTTNTAEERWQWVNNGIRLHREQGIPANPKDLLLHREISWIFLHKIQGFMDDANLYYKRQFAREWTIVLGPPRPADPTKPLLGTRTREQATADAAFHLNRILQAPDDLDEIIAKLPEAKELVEYLASNGMDIRTRDGRMSLLYANEYRRAMVRVGAALPGMVPGLGDAPIMQLFNAPALVPVWEQLIPHVRKRLLIDDYHMEVDRMVKYTLKFGPLDWRHPATHAVYWGSRGVDEALEKVTALNEGDFDFLNTDRVVLQAMQELFRTGTLQYDILHPDRLLAVNNAYFIPSYREVLDELVERENAQMRTKGAKPEERIFNLYSAGHENFMKDAIAFTYRRGDLARAQALKDQLNADYNRGLLNKNDPGLKSELELPMGEFVEKQVADRLTTPNVAIAEVFGSLHSAFLAGLAQGNSEVYTRDIEYAKMFHLNYMKEQYRNTGIDQKAARMEQMPKDFRDCCSRIFVVCVQASGLENGSIMYANAPQDLRVWVYDLLAEFIKPEIDQMVKNSEQANATAGGTSRGSSVPGFDRWFPKPDGIEAYRAERAAEKPNATPEAERERK